MVLLQYTFLHILNEIFSTNTCTLVRKKNQIANMQDFHNHNKYIYIPG